MGWTDGDTSGTRMGLRLKRALRTTDYADWGGQTLLATKLDVDRGSLSKWVSGSEVPEPMFAAKLWSDAAPWSAGVSHGLRVDWLRDRLDRKLSEDAKYAGAAAVEEARAGAPLLRPSAPSTDVPEHVSDAIAQVEAILLGAAPGPWIGKQIAHLRLEASFHPLPARAVGAEHAARPG